MPKRRYVLTDNLYTIEFKDDSRAVVTLSSEDHPVFKAHFPNNSILPGFVHFDIISDAFGINMTTIKKAKFLKTALPSQTLVYQRNRNRFKITCNNEEIASISL